MAKSIRPMWVRLEPEPGLGNRLPPVTPTPLRERALSIVRMSSDRLFLDRVARQHCPSRLHRQTQIKVLDGQNGTIYLRMVASVSTGCLSRGGKRIGHPPPRRSVPAGIVTKG